MVLLCAAAALFLGSCARTAPPPAAARVSIDYWEKWVGPEADAMREIVGDFNRSQDRIEVHFLSVSEVDTKLLLATSSGHPPDVAGIWSENIPDFAEKGALTPLDGGLAKYGLDGSRYIPLFWDLCRHRGLTWGLPTTPGCVALFYNKKLFRAAGLDPEKPPATFADFDAMSRRLTLVELERGGRRMRLRFDELTPAEQAGRHYDIVQVGHLPQDAGMFPSGWGCWFGARFYDGDRRILAADAGNLATYRWLRATAETYGVENLNNFTAGFGVAQSAQTPFLGGAEAMVMQGPWMANFIAQFAPGLEWGVCACPAQPGIGGGAPVTLAQTDVVVIPRGAPHPRAALEFIAYLQQRAVAEKLARAQQKFTALREVSPDFIPRHPNPAIGLFIELARSPAARTIPRLSIWREYDVELTVARERVLALHATPEVALAEVQSRMQWKLDRGMRRWDLIGTERMAEWRSDDPW
jgi:ABC-type glycerol-3-phosphate transport system substrate-binding protein